MELFLAAMGMAVEDEDVEAVVVVVEFAIDDRLLSAGSENRKPEFRPVEGSAGGVMVDVGLPLPSPLSWPVERCFVTRLPGGASPFS
jgi:hypothetical protein